MASQETKRGADRPGETTAAHVIDRRQFLQYTGTVLGGVTLASAAQAARAASHDLASTSGRGGNGSVATARPLVRVAADPSRIPPPITRRRPAVVPVTLEAREVMAEIEPGVRFRFMTYNGQIPGPFIRVREGDTIDLTFRNPRTNTEAHNVDFHAAMGPGGGALATWTEPGEEAHLRFRASYPGAFIYHCAVSNMDMHISSGMFGLILVEPKKGLPRVDREFYLGQHEIYTNKPAGLPGEHDFDVGAMVREEPSYVVINGAARGLTPKRYGAMHVRTGSTARVYFVVGGPNLSSSFHPIGNVWHELWPEGSVINAPLRFIQTYAVPPGSTTVATLRFPVAGDVKLVDHALTRVVHQGCLAVIHAEGAHDPTLFQAGGRRQL